MNAHTPAQAHEDPGHHHIASFRSLFVILAILLFMTALTVYTAKFVELGEAGILILAMIIACIKASLVCAIFMHLLHDKLLNDMVSRGALDPTRQNFIGPPPRAEAEVQAAVEKANAAHAAHDEHAPAGDAGHAPAEQGHAPAADKPAAEGDH